MPISNLLSKTALVLVLLLAGPAFAVEDERDFQEHYQRAMLLYRRNILRGALREFTAAYALNPLPRLLYNMGQLQRKCGDYRDAIESYELYLRTETEGPLFERMKAMPDSPERLAIKLKFMDEFLAHCQRLRKSKREFVFCGDFNVAHQQIDLKNWRSNQKNSGFLPEERAWLDGFMKSGFIDSFRMLNPEPHNYTWWSYRAGARGNNKGWRIDYCLVSEPLRSRIKRALILPEAKHSDHCPTTVEIS